MSHPLGTMKNPNSDCWYPEVEQVCFMCPTHPEMQSGEPGGLRNWDGGDLKDQISAQYPILSVNAHCFLGILCAYKGMWDPFWHN